MQRNRKQFLPTNSLNHLGWFGSGGQLGRKSAGCCQQGLQKRGHWQGVRLHKSLSGGRAPGATLDNEILVL
eukprot:1144596-Pelagomonas_calceolata.AAC.2